MTQPFEILQPGFFTESQVHGELLPGSKTYSPRWQERIERAWTPGPHLWDGPALSLINSHIEQGELFVTVQATTYKSYWGTNLAYAQEGYSDELANILAVCAVCVTADGYIPFGLRSDTVAESRNRWHVPGGNMEDYSRSPFAIMRMELREEIGLRDEDIAEMVCTGLGRGVEQFKPEFLFCVRLHLTADALRHRLPQAPDAYEHTRFEWVSKDAVENFFAGRTVAPIGCAAVFRALQYLDSK